MLSFKKPVVEDRPMCVPALPIHTCTCGTTLLFHVAEFVEAECGICSQGLVLLQNLFDNVTKS